MSWPRPIPPFVGTPHPLARLDIGQRLRSLADSIPDSATRATQDQLKEEQRRELYSEFVDFVTSGALEIATILRERNAPTDYFYKMKQGQIDSHGIGGFVLRERVKYGGFSRNPKHDIVPSYNRRSETSPHTHKLIIIAQSGKLAIAGYRSRRVLLDTSPAPSQWLNDSALADRSAYKKLKSEAQANWNKLYRHIF